MVGAGAKSNREGIWGNSEMYFEVVVALTLFGSGVVLQIAIGAYD